MINGSTRHYIDDGQSRPTGQNEEDTVQWVTIHRTLKKRNMLNGGLSMVVQTIWFWTITL